ncbi:MAG: DNA gyrase inhibitor YacG [Burkholderiaceae bacterium]
MTESTSQLKIVQCPTCRGSSVFTPENPFRPFCSARCKNIDFGAWASEAFRVAAQTSRAEDEPDEPEADPH